MSAFVYRKQFGVMTFRAFVTEAIIPKHISFGKDFKDSDWFSPTPITHFTYFRYDNKFFCVMIEDGDVGFGVSLKPPPKELDSIRRVVRYFSFDRHKALSAALVFDYIMFVVIAGIHKFELPSITFNGADYGLETFYSRLVRSKTFIRELDKLGFVYTGEDEDKAHRFERKIT